MKTGNIVNDASQFCSEIHFFPYAKLIKFSNMFYVLELTSDTLESFRNSFSKDPKNLFSQNVVSRSDPLETCLQRKTLETTNHVYSHKVIN
jgi:hypothetical protein